MVEKISNTGIGLMLILSLSACTRTSVHVDVNNMVSAPEPTKPISSAHSDKNAELAFEIPSTHNIDVPFSPQAPEGDWGDPYQEACEEMSAIMVHAYLEGKPLSVESAKNQLLETVRLQEGMNLPQDITLVQLAQVIEKQYGYETAILEDPTIDTLKFHLANNMPIIMPAAGRELGNPYFSGEGPWYHMLVITGYDRNEFITNDPGTRRGKGFKYDYETLMNAMHDWTGIKEEIGKGRKAVLIVTENQ